MQIWIDEFDGEYYMLDAPNSWSAGPVEISNELHERIQESTREFIVIQDIMSSLVYDWRYPEDD